MLINSLNWVKLGFWVKLGSVLPRVIGVPAVPYYVCK